MMDKFPQMSRALCVLANRLLRSLAAARSTSRGSNLSFTLLLRSALPQNAAQQANGVT